MANHILLGIVSFFCVIGISSTLYALIRGINNILFDEWYMALVFIVPLLAIFTFLTHEFIYRVIASGL